VGTTLCQQANMEAVQKVLSAYSAYELSKRLGISQSGIGKWKNGLVALESMSFGNAIKLTEFYNNQQRKEEK
jgi:hypothetical protein